MAILKMSDMLALPVTRVPGGVMPFLKDGNGLVLFVGDQYHVDICVTAINEYDKHVAEIEALTKRVTELEMFADKIVNWNEQFSIKTRCDIGSLGQQQHFQQLAAKVLNN